jgi:mRNA-degrading endonuclease RelE of RelBE toxin-antitoxin system
LLKIRAGDSIQRTNGLRKIRWKATGRGKSGGVRVIYLHVSAQAQFFLLAMQATIPTDE